MCKNFIAGPYDSWIVEQEEEEESKSDTDESNIFLLLYQLLPGCVRLLYCEECFLASATLSDTILHCLNGIFRFTVTCYKAEWRTRDKCCPCIRKHHRLPTERWIECSAWCLHILLVIIYFMSCFIIFSLSFSWLDDWKCTGILPVQTAC